jgi:TonB C terminal
VEYLTAEHNRQDGVVNNDKKKVDVVDWQDIPPLIVTRAGPPRRYFSPAPIGIVGTLLIHALILPSAYFGSYGTKVQRPEIQEPGAFSNSEARSETSLVLIALPTKSNSNQDAAQSISSALDLRNTLANSPVHLDPPEPLRVLTLGEEQALQSRTVSGDGAEQARLFGIYTGQIKARINRIWRRPRTVVNEVEVGRSVSSDDSFQCEAQIVQDAQGNVQEILLPLCNGSPAWQRSLVAAIQQASPLPAPPSASVFSHSISLNFVGVPYTPGAPDDDYELTPQLASEAAPTGADAALSDPQWKALFPEPQSLGSRN